MEEGEKAVGDVSVGQAAIDDAIAEEEGRGQAREGEEKGMQRVDLALNKGSFGMIDAVDLQVEEVIEHARAHGDEGGGDGCGVWLVRSGVRERTKEW